jgi:AcrR family transcriptional regulator
VKLTDQLVKGGRGGRGATAARRPKPPGRRGRPAGGPGRRPGPVADDSRQRIFAAAAHEFAARGFAGASVDRIAAAAGFNKAMIYYHFGSKAALYRDILRDMFEAVGAAVAAAAGSSAAPPDKIRRFIDAFAIEAEARPHFPPIWFREIAEGGTHVDDATLGVMARIVKSLGAIIDEGVRGRAFQPVSTVIVHAGIVAPLLLYFASAGLRRRIQRIGVRGVGEIQRDQIVAHIQRVTVALLEGRIA